MVLPAFYLENLLCFGRTIRNSVLYVNGKHYGILCSHRGSIFHNNGAVRIISFTYKQLILKILAVDDYYLKGAQ
jgi:hypothetical protein